MCSLPLEPLSHFPPHPIPLGCQRAPGLNFLCHIANSHWVPISHIVMCMFQYYSLYLSHPLLLLYPQVCYLGLHPHCCPENRFFSTILLDSICSCPFAKSCWLFETPWSAASETFLSFTVSQVSSNSYLLSWWCHPTISSSVIPFSCPQNICVNIWHLLFSFWLTSLCIIGSRFIHLISTDWNVFLFNGWVIFHCIYVPHILYPLICPWASRLLPCPAIVNSAAVNIGIPVSFSVMFFSVFMPNIGIVGSYGDFIPRFLRNHHTVFHSGCINLECK